MLRTCLSTISLVWLLCTCAHAEDYLLRLETSGFRDASQQENLPPEKTLESIEVVARVGEPFYGNSTIGSAKISLHGVLEQLKDGRFRVQLQYRKSAESDESIAVPNGARVPITKSTNIDTTVILELKKAADLGIVDANNRTFGGVEKRTKTHSTLTLEKFDLSLTATPRFGTLRQHSPAYGSSPYVRGDQQ